MLLKFWAFVYRKTGYFSNYAKAKEWKYIEPQLDEYMQDKDLGFKTRLSIEIGSWQARNGFYRPFNYLKRR